MRVRINHDYMPNECTYQHLCTRKKRHPVELEGKPGYEVIQRDARPAPNSTGGKIQLNMKRGQKRARTIYFPKYKVMSKGATGDESCNGTKNVPSGENTESRGREPEKGKTGSSVRVAKAKGALSKKRKQWGTLRNESGPAKEVEIQPGLPLDAVSK